MASSPEFVRFVVDQLSEAGDIRCRKMFGEVALYLDGKYFAGIMDDRFLIKITEAGRQMMPDALTALPYEGGKPMFLIDHLEDRHFLAELAAATAAELPLPKAKKPKKNKPDRIPRQGE